MYYIFITSYFIFVTFLHNHNLRPEHFTLESAQMCDESCLTTKQRKQTHIFVLCVRYIHCV